LTSRPGHIAASGEAFIADVLRPRFLTEDPSLFRSPFLARRRFVPREFEEAFMRIEYIGSDCSTCLATGEAANGSASFQAFRAQAWT
jgi:hypothetical protein